MEVQVAHFGKRSASQLAGVRMNAVTDQARRPSRAQRGLALMVGRRRDRTRVSGTTRRPPSRRHSIIRGVISVIVVFGLWQAAIEILHPSPIVIVGPDAIVRSFGQLAADGTLWVDFRTSMTQFVLGYAIGVLLLAVPIGLLMGSNRRVRDYGDPWLTALYATPTIALAPLLIVWLGFGLSAHVAVVALTAFFPAAINSMDGISQVDEDLRDLAKAYRASSWERFWRVDLPGALPYIFTGLRQALARGLVGVVVADLFGAEKGLGYLILTSAQTFSTGDLFVGVLVLAALGILFTVVLRALQKKLMPWAPENVV